MGTKSILIIDDNELNIKLIKGLLKKRKPEYVILEALTAKDGIKIAFENIPDLILMDIQLPDMNGLDATKEIKRETKTRDIPIVALTSYAMDGDEEKAKNSGCSGYITKPIDTREFLINIERFLK
jgi:CheY-like chemotaxis protein